MHENALFLLKNCKNILALGVSSPDPLASGDWRLCPQTLSLRRLRPQTSSPDFWKFVIKVMHFRHISAKIQPKNLKLAYY